MLSTNKGGGGHFAKFIPTTHIAMDPPVVGYLNRRLAAESFKQRSFAGSGRLHLPA